MTFFELTLLAEDDFMAGMEEFESRAKQIYEIFYYVYEGRCVVTVSTDTEATIMYWVTSPKEGETVKRALKALREKGEYEEVDDITGSTHWYTYDKDKATHYYKMLEQSANEQGLEFQSYGDAI